MQPIDIQMRAKSELEAGFALRNTADLQWPVLLSVPHAGREYPNEIYDQLRLPPASLARLEDRYADYLSRDAIAAGIPTIVALRPRAWIDLNRDPRDMDQEMLAPADRDYGITPGIKTRGGLGLVPRRLSGEGDIWRRLFSGAEIAARVENFHRPYHQRISTILAEMRARFGGAILLDLHSMPPLEGSFGNPPAAFVVGDVFGKSASGQVSETLLAHIKQAGFRGQLNHPYAGDYILRTHGAVARNIHAVQLEVDRALYLDQNLQLPGPRLAQITALVANLCRALAHNGLHSRFMDAAE
jgi:N-formylglutamate amidohydrolase